MPEPEEEELESSPEESVDEPPDDKVLDPVDEEARCAAVTLAISAMTKEDWRLLTRKLTATAFALSNNRARAAEFVSEAVTLVLEGRRKWDPRRGQLLTFLRVVVRTLVDHSFASSATKHEVAPDSERDENIPPSSPGTLDTLVARDERDVSNQRFAELTAELGRSRRGMAIVRCAQRGIEDPRDQATALNVKSTVVYEARRRVRDAFRTVYARHPDAPRLPKETPDDGEHADVPRATKEEDDK